MNKISSQKLWLAIGTLVFCAGMALTNSAYAGPVGAPIIFTSTLTVNLVNDPTGPATSADFNLAVTDVATTTNVAASDSQSFVMNTNDPYTVTEATTTNSADYTVTLGSGCSGTLSANTTCTITNTYVAPPVVIPPPTPTSTLTVNVSGLTGSDTAMIAVNDATTSTLSISTTTGNATMPIVLDMNDAYSVDATTTALNYTLDLSGCPSGTLATDTTCNITFTFVPPAPVVPPVTPAPSSGSSSGGSGSGGSGSVNNDGVTYLVGQGNDVNTTTTTATTTENNGTVLGTSTVSDPAALIVTLEQQLIGLQMKAANCSFVFNRNLYSGMTSNDVQNLQSELNMSSLTEVATTGSGSPGNESTYFGPATKNAVITFQNIFADQILVPQGLSAGNGFVGPSTRAVLNQLCSS